MISKIFVSFAVFACLFLGTYASAENRNVESTLPASWHMYASVMPVRGGSNLNTQLVLETLIPGTILEVRFSKPGAEKWTPTSITVSRDDLSTRWISGSILHGPYVDVRITVRFAGITGDIIVRRVPIERNQELTVGADFPPLSAQ